MEPVAVRIIVMIVGIVQAYGEYSEYRQRMQFVGLRDPIVVLIDPKQKLRIHRVAAIDDPVSVSPVLEFVELAKARYPLGSSDLGWAVKLPKSSFPLSILPLWLRSSGRKALLEFAAVHAILTGCPSPAMSNITPPAAVVRWKPFPVVSTMIGDAG